MNVLNALRNDEPIFFHPKYTLIDNDILKRNEIDNDNKKNTNDNNTNINNEDAETDEEVIAEVARYIEAIIIHKFHFISLVLPDESARVTTTVLTSNDWETNERLLLIVQNANGCKLGIFSRTICLEKGFLFVIIPFIIVMIIVIII
jgi:hypothetical protein